MGSMKSEKIRFTKLAADRSRNVMGENKWLTLIQNATVKNEKRES